MDPTSQAVPISKATLWASRIIQGLVVLFLIFDGVTKVIKEPHVMAASQQLGFTANAIVGIGAVLLICTALYVIPRTSILGAILLTGYLGGAVATNVPSDPYFEQLTKNLTDLGNAIRAFKNDGREVKE